MPNSSIQSVPRTLPVFVDETGLAAAPVSAANPLPVLATAFDPEAEVYGVISPYGAQKIAEVTRLCGGTFGTGATLNAFRWTGTATQANSMATVAAGQTLQTARIARFFAGSSNEFLANMRHVHAPASGNVRRWGVFTADAADGLFFQLDGTSFGVVTRRGSTDTVVPVAQFNGDSMFVSDTDNHTWVIHYNPGGASFFVYVGKDRHLLHHVNAAAAPLANTPHFHGRADSTGGTGSMEFRGLVVQKFGGTESRLNYYHTTTAETKVLKSGPGTLHNLIVGRKGTGSAGAIFYDNTAGSGTILTDVDIVNTLGSLPLSIDFNTGCTMVTSGTVGDITVTFD